MTRTRRRLAAALATAALAVAGTFVAAPAHAQVFDDPVDLSPCLSRGLFNGSAVAAPSLFRPSNGTWYNWPANGAGVNFGTPTDVPCAFDYLGNGQSQRAVFRPDNGMWYVEGVLPQGTPFGGPGDWPIPAKYDPASPAEKIAVFRESNGTWYVKDYAPGGIPFGGPGDIPVPGNFTSGNYDNPAVYRPSTGQWFIKDVNPGGIAFGTPVFDDFPVVGDFNCDGVADIGIYRIDTGFWYFDYNLDGVQDAYAQFGVPGIDLPVPGNYLGLTAPNGKACSQPAVFRTTNFTWYTSANPGGVPFGAPQDVLITEK